MAIPPERIYINMAASAGQQSFLVTERPEAAYLPTSRSVPIVADISKYKLSVVRAVLQGSCNFPIWIPAIKTGQTNVNLTVYNVTASVFFPGAVANFTSTQPITWISQNSSWPTPPAPLLQQTESPYYWMYSYTHFIGLMNTTMNAVVSDIAAQAVLAGVAVPVAWQAGVFRVKYDTSARSFTLTAPAAWIDAFIPVPVATAVQFTLNEILVNLLSWPAVYSRDFSP